ncbi:hypothetical protein [Spiroplasma endosymbiont of Cleonymus obscurus]|uniref:hypothetical protein n=1 Tax=Spiroplasma endosymbiont of Cleonymus obscurus TaxID=3066324 RepID=UPI0037DDB907
MPKVIAPTGIQTGNITALAIPPTAPALAAAVIISVFNCSLERSLTTLRTCLESF